MKLFRAILYIISLAVATPSLAQATPETLANDVLVAYQKGNVDEFSKLVTASPLLDKTATLKAQIKTNIQTLLDIYGPVEGWELVRAKSASDRYVENSYLIFQNEYATRLKLSFYKRSSGWIIASFKIDDSISELLEEAD
ncbi:hypothetical protein [Sphingorhabdus sp. M41]|uniref:hypothetical protein n=1 Tax=Sphingorhabdus sp. M41 TaxID=1806885 RepID=UPI00078B9126|nr:hypothetical protein [Sphingorhabdus sp. M41]AMO72976.1 hypothetical protein AZE99_14940 [Sphingorhabdus sp. M41]